MAFEDSRAFLQSNSLIAKVAFLLLVVMVFVFVLRLGTQFMSWLFQPSGSPILIDGLIDGDQYMVIDQDPKNKNSIPVLRSDDERTGIEFTWSVWLLIKDFERDSEKYKHIFHKGNDSAATETSGLIQPNNAPGVYIHPNRNSLVILMNTFTSINEEIMERALEQALEARLHILGQMNTVLDAPREITSENAPSMTTLKVDQDKIRDIIGKGGATIRLITEESGATVDIDDDGTVKVFGQNAAARDAAIEMIQAITAEAEIGEIYTGTVARIVDFGAFVTILPGKDGLVHISQIADERVENVTDYLSEGQEVQVKVLDVDQRGRIKLSMREVAADAADAPADSVDTAEPEEESLAQE